MPGILLDSCKDEIFDHQVKEVTVYLELPNSSGPNNSLL